MFTSIISPLVECINVALICLVRLYDAVELEVATKQQGKATAAAKAAASVPVYALPSLRNGEASVRKLIVEHLAMRCSEPFKLVKRCQVPIVARLALALLVVLFAGSYSSTLVWFTQQTVALTPGSRRSSAVPWKLMSVDTLLPDDMTLRSVQAACKKGGVIVAVPVSG